MAKSINRFIYKYPVFPPLLGFSVGIILNEYIPGNYIWAVVLTLGIFLGLVSLFAHKLRFLLLVPIGLMFAWGPLTTQKSDIDNYLGSRIDIEGTLYKSPEVREYGTRLYLDTESVIISGAITPTNGKILITSGGELSGVRYGDRIRVLDVELKEFRNFLNPGSFDIKSYYERQGIRARGYTEGDEYIISFGKAPSSNPLLYYLDGVRIRFGSFVTQNFKYPESALLNAITVGFRAGIPDDLRAEFSRAGVAHVLAISGLHVGVVAVFFYFLIKFALSRSEYLLLRFQVPRLAAGLTILPVFIYTALAGFSTSAVRAFIMVTLYLVSVAIGRDENKINTLGGAALIILIWHPWSLFELSFKLSFSAVLAILLVHNVYPFKFFTIKDKFYSLVKSTVAAGFVTMPLVVNSFGILPLLSIPANIVLVPFVEFLIIPLGLISLAVFLISPYLAEPLIAMNILVMDWVVLGMRLLNELPSSYLLVPKLSPVSWIIFIGAGLSLLLLRKISLLKYVFPMLVLSFFLSIFLTFPGNAHKEHSKINILDAGINRSAVFINLPDGKNILLDGGFKKFGEFGYSEKVVIAKYLLHQGITTIDYLILSSTDKDHLEGIEYLLQNFSVHNFYTNGNKLKGGVWELIYGRNIMWKDFLELEEIELSEGYKIKIIKPGDNYDPTDSSLPYPALFKFMGPDLSFITGEGLETEDVQNSLILTGGDELSSRILYMPVLKSNESLSGFINTVQPEVFVVNSLEDFDAGKTYSPLMIFQTSHNGTVTIEEIQNKLNIKTFTDD